MRNLGLKLVLVGIVLSFQAFSQTTVQDNGQLSISGNKIINASGDPVQLQGMSLFWSQWYPEFYNEDVVNWIADDWCANVIRAAMAVDYQGGYLYDSKQEDLVETVVDAAIARNIYVVIDWHTHSAENNTEEAAEFFGRMAQQYGSYPHVIYEIYNEPIGQSWSGVIKPYAEQVLDSIRKYDPDNIVVVGTPTWSQDVNVASKDPITKYNNIAYTLHYYAAQPEHKAALRAKAQEALDDGICLFVTEYGSVEASGDGAVDEQSSNEWYDFLALNKISHCNWSICDKDEGASALKPGASSLGGWTASDLTESGTLVRNYLKSTCASYEGEPVIITQPEGKGVQDGSDVTIYVSASGGDLSYQWFKDGAMLNGETNYILTINNFSDSDEGSYFVVIQNTHGVVQSDDASLELSDLLPYGGQLRHIPGRVETEDYDTGGEGVSYHDNTPGNNTWMYRSDDVDIQNNTFSATGFYVDPAPDEWLNFSIYADSQGVYNITTLFASRSPQLSISVDGEFQFTKTLGGVATGAFVLEDVGDIFLTEGTHIIQVFFNSTAWGYDYFDFTFDDNYDCKGNLGGTAYMDDCKECIDESEGEEPCYPLAISDNKKDYGIIFPNPVLETIYLSQNQATAYTIINLDGVEIQKGTSTPAGISVKNISPGVYFIKVNNKVERFIKK